MTKASFSFTLVFPNPTIAKNTSWRFSVSKYLVFLIWIDKKRLLALIFQDQAFAKRMAS